MAGIKQILSINSITGMHQKQYIGSFLFICLLLLGACNAKDEPEKIDTQIAPSVAVTKFSIKPNASVMSDLDSVFFSIDLDHKVIYNADSLPKGTKIDKLVPLITYPASVTRAEITMTGGETREGTVNYVSNPSDSIDFTGHVSLRLSNDDESVSMTYTLKVNVHKTVADSLMWDKEAVSALPSRMASPRDQKTVSVGKDIVSLIEEANSTFTLARCQNPAESSWSKEEVTFPFVPQVRSFSTDGTNLYILDSSKSLFKSTDGKNWTAAGCEWIGIIGEFNGSLLGIMPGPSPLFDIYPRPADFTPRALPDNFPTEDFSNFNSFSSKWSATPIGFFTGGSRAGTASNATWAYDGETWTIISDNPLPPLRNAVVVPYFSYLKTTTSWIQTEYSVWLCMGGTDASGNPNETLYISYDNGVNWAKAGDLMQYPDFIRSGYSADAIIRSIPRTASLDDNWRKIRASRHTPQMRLSYTIEGSQIDWECPYIYLFGGFGKDGKLNDEIRRAVLARLTFTPIF